MKKQRYMAFWKYDLYPYILFGEIDMKQETHLWKGKISYYIPSYQGHYVPEFILPLNEGAELGNLLKQLRAEKRQAEKELLNSFVDKLSDVLKKYEVDYPIK